MIIYKATNLVTGKVYIGQTSQDFEERKRQHLRKARNGVKTVFYNSIRKHGEENFSWEIIDQCTSQDELNEKEIHWVAHYRSFIKVEMCNGYNMTVGGGGLGIGENNPNFGTKRSMETRMKISASNMGKVMSAVSREKMRQAKQGIEGENHPRYGTTHSAETRLLLRERKIGKPLSDEHKQKLKDARKDKQWGADNHMYGRNGELHHAYGTIMSEETKKKISDSHKGKKLSDDHREKIVKNLSHNSGKDNVMAKAVVQLSMEGEYINRYDTMLEAVKAIDGDSSCISRCCKGKVKSHKKFKWMYEADFLKTN